jgi:hypothetical protein
LAERLRVDVLLKESKVTVARILFQVTGKSDLAATVGIGLVVNLVNGLQALRSDANIAVDRAVGNSGELQTDNFMLGLVVRTDVGKAGGRLDQVDVLSNVLWDRVLECAENLAWLGLITDVPTELGVEQLVGSTNGGLECGPIAVYLNIVDTGSLEPRSHR